MYGNFEANLILSSNNLNSRPNAAFIKVAPTRSSNRLNSRSLSQLDKRTQATKSESVTARSG